jgi:nucleotide-binding universal stress UspA family protein
MHIFLVTDGSASARHAQAQILSMPWRTPVHVTVMTALDAPDPPLASWIPAARQAIDIAADQLRRDMETSGRELLETARLALEGKVASVGTRMHEGKAGLKIVEMSRACRADLVAVGSQGLGTYNEFFLGSVSDYVANHARCPVLLAKTPPRGNRRFLLALDDSAHSAAVVRWLGELDLPEGTWLHLVKVFRSMKDFPASDDEDRERIDGGISPEKFTAWNDAPEVLEALLSQKLDSGGVRVTVEVRFGQAAPELLASLRRFEPDLLVMGAKGRNSQPDWALGSVAQHLLDHAPCSVVIVRPSGKRPAQSSFR